MTVEERLDRIEQLHAEQLELAKQDRIAYIAWKRDMESQVQATWRAIERYADENRKGFAESRRLMDDGMAEMRKEIAARDKATDERINKLVSGIGELIRRMDNVK